MLHYQCMASVVSFYTPKCRKIFNYRLTISIKMKLCFEGIEIRRGNDRWDGRSIDDHIILQESKSKNKVLIVLSSKIMEDSTVNPVYVQHFHNN